MGAPWAPETTPKRTKSKHFAEVFCTPISGCLLARIVAETGSELHDRNSVSTAPARADRMSAVLQKTHPGATFFVDFDIVLDTKLPHLGHFGFTMSLFFVAGFVDAVGVMETVAPQPRIKSSQRSKSI